MNRLMSGGPFPFWGCSKKDELTTLSVKKSREHEPGEVAEFRVVEQVALAEKKARPQPVWKIAYAGAVGGQTMTGVPALERLREKFPAMRIWPFELSLSPLKSDDLEGVRIVVAEVNPAVTTARQEAAEIPDETQVRGVVEWLAERDASGKLGALFQPAKPLPEASKAAAETEEGWILGI
jgi:hypothetical protein